MDKIELQQLRNIIIMYIHVLMRDEKEGRKKQVRSNTQQCKPQSTPIYVYMYVHMTMNTIAGDYEHDMT